MNQMGLGATRKNATFFQQEHYGQNTVGEAGHCQNYIDLILIIPISWSVAPDSSSQGRGGGREDLYLSTSVVEAGYHVPPISHIWKISLQTGRG